MLEYELHGTIVYYDCLGYSLTDFISDRDRIYYVGYKKYVLDLKFALRKLRPVLFELDENKNFKNDIHITGIKSGTLREYLEEVHGL